MRESSIGPLVGPNYASRFMNIYPKPAVTLDDIVDAQPDMDVRDFAEHYLGHHSLRDCSLDPLEAPLISTHVIVIPFYKRGRFSVHVVVHTPDSDSPAYTLPLTQQAAVYVAGEMTFTHESEQIVPLQAWDFFVVKPGHRLAFKAGPSGATTLSIRRGPSSLLRTDSGSEESAAETLVLDTADGDSLTAQTAGSTSGQSHCAHNAAIVGSNPAPAKLSERTAPTGS